MLSAPYKSARAHVILVFACLSNLCNTHNGLSVGMSNIITGETKNQLWSNNQTNLEKTNYDNASYLSSIGNRLLQEFIKYAQSWINYLMPSSADWHFKTHFCCHATLHDVETRKCRFEVVSRETCTAISLTRLVLFCFLFELDTDSKQETIKRNTVTVAQENLWVSCH